MEIGEPYNVGTVAGLPTVGEATRTTYVNPCTPDAFAEIGLENRPTENPTTRERQIAPRYLNGFILNCLRFWGDNYCVLPKKPTTYYAIALVLVGFCVGDFVFSSYEYKAFVAAIIFILAMLSLMMGTSIVLMRDGFLRKK